MKWLLATLAVSGPLAACAKAGSENAIVGGIGRDAGTIDGRDFPEPDASPIDAPPNQVTLSQTTANTITELNSVACALANDTTTDNRYYRVFQPSAFGVASTLHVTQVEFGVEEADAGTGALSQAAQVEIATYSGALTGTTLDSSMITKIATADVSIPNGKGFTMSAPIRGDVRPDAQLVVSLHIPDGAGKRVFYLGSNAQGERGEGYLQAAACADDPDLAEPTAISSFTSRQISILLSVTGTF